MAQTIVTLSGDDAELYKAFQRIIDQQNKTDAGYKKIRSASKEAADAAKAAAKEQADAEAKRQQRIDTAIGSVTALVTAYVSVSGAVNALTQAHEVLIDNQDKALGLAKQLAAAQQEAAKNLAGQTPQAISETLQKTVPTIQREAMFADTGKLTLALGSAASIVGEQRAISAVTESAKVTRFTPDQLQPTATATADIMAATGLNDAKQALALLTSTGSVARPEQLSKLAQGAAASVNAAIAQAPAQDKVDAAREGVALYAKLSKVDPQGQAAATATTDFIRQISAVFADPKLLKDRTERIENLRLGTTDNQLAVESAKLKIQETERTAGFFKPADQSPEANTARLKAEQAKQDLLQAELKTKRDADELKRLDAVQRVTQGITPMQSVDANLQAKHQADETVRSTNLRISQLLGELQTKFAGDPEIMNKLSKPVGEIPTPFENDPLVKEFKTLQAQQVIAPRVEPITAPTTFMQRLQTVRQTPELRATVAETLTGEAKFQPLFKELLDGNSALARELADAMNTITTDTKSFTDVVQSTVETPQARIVGAINQVDTARNIQMATDTDGQVRAAVNQIFADTMRGTSIDFTTAMGSVGSRTMAGISRGMDPAIAVGGNEIQVLRDRIEYLQNRGGTNEQIQSATAGIEAIQQILVLPERLEALRAAGENTNQYLQMQLKAIEETNQLLRAGGNQPIQPAAANNLRGMLMAPGANAGAAP
jgi:hypothetical protein